MANDSSPDWNDINDEYLRTRDQRAPEREQDITEEQANHRRITAEVLQNQRDADQARRLVEEQRMQEAQQPPPQPRPEWNHIVTTHEGAAGTVTTTTTADGDSDMVLDEHTTITANTWGELGGGGTGNVGIVTDSPMYTYTAPATDKALIKEAIKEVMKELFEEETNFMKWLQLKYTLIPVVPEKAAKTRRRRRNVSIVSTPRRGHAGSVVRTEGRAAGSATASVRLTGDVSETPDQGGGERSDNGGNHPGTRP